jgi:hypothetical protein
MKNRKISWFGLTFVAFYLLFWMFGYIDFFQCNGWQFSVTHGKCTGELLFMLFVVSPINIPIVLLLEALHLGTENLSVFQEYLRSGILILLNSILIYYGTRWLEKLDEKYS